MRTLFVVLLLPRRELAPRVEQVLKPAHVQKLLAQLAVETLASSVLGRLARLEVLQLDLALDCPGQKMPAGQLGSVVAADRLRQSVFPHDPI